MINFLPHIVEKIRQSELLVVGGSAGSFHIMKEMVAALPAQFGMPVVVVLHRKQDHNSTLPGLFQQHAAAIIREAEEKELLKAGQVYIAPADYHLLIEKDHTLSFDLSEPVWYCRPAIDVLFESAADVFGSRVIGILLSGANEDGGNGMKQIHDLGGFTLAQHPDDAEFSNMPETAISRNAVDQVFYSAHIADIIEKINEIKEQNTNN